MNRSSGFGTARQSEKAGDNAVHVQELRDVLNEARAGLALGGRTFTDPLLTGLAAKAVHVNDLRGGVR